LVGQSDSALKRAESRSTLRVDRNLKWVAMNLESFDIVWLYARPQMRLEFGFSISSTLTPTEIYLPRTTKHNRDSRQMGRDASND